MGSRSGGRLGEDPNPNGDRTNDRVFSLALFFTLGVFFVLGRFVDLDLLETNDVYRRKADLEIAVSESTIRRILTNRVSVHNLDDLPAQVAVPNLRDRMGKDFAQLLQTTPQVPWEETTVPCPCGKVIWAQNAGLHSRTQPPPWRQRADQG